MTLSSAFLWVIIVVLMKIESNTIKKCIDETGRLFSHVRYIVLYTVLVSEYLGHCKFNNIKIPKFLADWILFNTKLIL